MYRTRLRTPANVELTTEWHKTNEALVKGVESDWSRNVPVVLLDPKGKKHSSESFSSELYRLVEEGGSRLVYVIGGVSVFECLVVSDSVCYATTRSHVCLCLPLRFCRQKACPRHCDQTHKVSSLVFPT
jgi:hypothetical protein